MVPAFRTHREPSQPCNVNDNHHRTNHACMRGGCFGSAYTRREPCDEIVAEFVAEPTAAYSRSCVGKSVDWWALGVLIYELLYGTTPFEGESKESTLRNIASGKQVRFPVAEKEEEMAEAGDLIEKLLVKDPRRRLGCAGGATDVKRHPFFDGIKRPLIRSYPPPTEARELTARKLKSKSKGHGHVSRRRRRWQWQGLEFLMKTQGSKSKHSRYYSRCSASNHSNGNYYPLLCQE